MFATEGGRQCSIELDRQWIVMSADGNVVLGSRGGVSVGAGLPKDPVLVRKYPLAVLFRTKGGSVVALDLDPAVKGRHQLGGTDRLLADMKDGSGVEDCAGALLWHAQEDTVKG